MDGAVVLTIMEGEEVEENCPLCSAYSIPGALDVILNIKEITFKYR